LAGAIWVTPCFPSPQVDFGYDVSDYEAIDPMYGTMKDFDRLLAEGKSAHVRVITRFVVNHTSESSHKWFSGFEVVKDFRASRLVHLAATAKGRDSRRTNWGFFTFGCLHEARPEDNQYYYHYFYP